MLQRLFLAAALAVGLSSHGWAQNAQGQRVTLVDERGVPIGAANPLASGGSVGSVGSAGTNGTQAQSVQGINGGVPQATTIRGAGTNRSATVGTTAITLMPANPTRQGWNIKNDTSGDIWINFDTTATATAGGGNIRVPTNTYLASEPGFIETGAMSAIGSAGGLAITAREH